MAQGIGRINEVAVQTSEAAQQTTLASGEMAELAASLQHKVGLFRV